MPNNMSKKSNPFDVLYKLGKDEEYFCLAARDPMAPGLVRLWAALRMGDAVRANISAGNLIESIDLIPNDSAEKIYEAVDCSIKMEAWYEKHRKIDDETRLLTEATKEAEPAAAEEAGDDEGPFEE